MVVVHIKLGSRGTGLTCFLKVVCVCVRVCVCVFVVCVCLFVYALVSYLFVCFFVYLVVCLFICCSCCGVGVRTLPDARDLRPCPHSILRSVLLLFCLFCVLQLES